MRNIGYYGELLAAQYLINCGHQIVKRNFYTRFGELDIISRINNRLHVIEVKYVSHSYIHSSYKLNRKKRRRMIQCTQLFLDQFKLTNVYVQFDLIIITNNQVNHTQNIFNVSDV